MDGLDITAQDDKEETKLVSIGIELSIFVYI
jgi:hypothetical protein